MSEMMYKLVQSQLTVDQQRMLRMLLLLVLMMSMTMTMVMLYSWMLCRLHRLLADIPALPSAQTTS